MSYRCKRCGAQTQPSERLDGFCSRRCYVKAHAPKGNAESKSMTTHVVFHPRDVEALCGVHRDRMATEPVSLRGDGVTCRPCNRERRLWRGNLNGAGINES